MRAQTKVASGNVLQRDGLTMILKITLAAAVLILLTLGPQSLAGQTPPAQKPLALTGCVQRGEAVTSYKLVNKDGIWNLGGGEKLKIGKQVDHTVTVRGKVVETYEAKAGDLKGRDPNLRGIFDVTSLKTIRNSCTANEF